MWTSNIFGLWYSGSSESAIMIIGRACACLVSGVKSVTVDLGADSSELSCRNISGKYWFGSRVPVFLLLRPTRLYCIRI